MLRDRPIASAVGRRDWWHGQRCRWSVCPPTHAFMPANLAGQGMSEDDIEVVLDKGIMLFRYLQVGCRDECRLVCCVTLLRWKSAIGPPKRNQ